MGGYADQGWVDAGWADEGWADQPGEPGGGDGDGAGIGNNSDILLLGVQ